MGFNYTMDIATIISDVMQMGRKLDEIERRLAVVEKELASDVRENVRGRWEDCSNGWMCSECYHSQIHETNYCPNCGANMKGKEIIESVRNKHTYYECKCN